MLAAGLGPDLVLLDVCMPGIDGVETARRLKAAHPASTIVLLSTARLEDRAADLASCGAVAFVPKEAFGPAMLRRVWDEHGGRFRDLRFGLAAPPRENQSVAGSATGRRPRIVVPCLGVDCDGQGPSERRDAVGHVREPGAGAPRRLDVAADSVVFDLEVELVLVLPHAYHGTDVRAGVLADILERFQAAEVDGRLDLLRIAADRRGLELRRRGSAPRDAGESFPKPELAEDGRIQSLGEVSELVQDLLELGAEVRKPESNLRIRLGELCGHPDPDAQCDEMLLRAVVKIALDPAALDVSCRHDAGARCAEIRAWWTPARSADDRSRARGAAPDRRRRGAPGLYRAPSRAR